eukprot:4615278-Amphidinium_carterae.1
MAAEHSRGVVKFADEQDVGNQTRAESARLRSRSPEVRNPFRMNPPEHLAGPTVLPNSAFAYPEQLAPSGFGIRAAELPELTRSVHSVSHQPLAQHPRDASGLARSVHSASHSPLVQHLRDTSGDPSMAAYVDYRPPSVAAAVA